MLKMYNSSYKHNNMNTMANMMLTHSLLEFTDMLLFTMCVVTFLNNPTKKGGAKLYVTAL
jgi:hypothetical protein